MTTDTEAAYRQGWHDGILNDVGAEPVRLYQHDLSLVVEFFAVVEDAIDGLKDVYANKMTVDLWNKNGYRIGELRHEDEQWSFIPHIQGREDS